MGGVVMVEERSAATAVEAVARHLGLADKLVIIAFEGKSDLERSFCRKVTGWRHPPDVRFLVSRDNDGGDCLALKRRLLDLVPGDYAARIKVRLVMQSLEAWYLGDFVALAASGLVSPQAAAAQAGRARFRDPDRLPNAEQVLARLCSDPLPGKIGTAQRIGPHLVPGRNQSRGFGHFVSALQWVAEELSP